MSHQRLSGLDRTWLAWSGMYASPLHFRAQVPGAPVRADGKRLLPAYGVRSEISHTLE